MRCERLYHRAQGTIDHHHCGQCRDPLGFAPVGEIGQTIGTDQEEELILGSLAADLLERVDAVMRAGPARLELRYRKRGMARGRDPDHLQAIGDRSPVARLVRRRAGDHKPDLVKPAGLAAALGQDQVPQVDRIKRPPEQPYSHWFGSQLGRSAWWTRKVSTSTAYLVTAVDRRAEIG